MINTEQMTVYTLFCDTCGKQYESHNDGNYFFDALDATTLASEDGWVEDDYFTDGSPIPVSLQSEHHFCSEKCREEWLAKKRQPKCLGG